MDVRAARVKKKEFFFKRLIFMILFAWILRKSYKYDILERIRLDLIKIFRIVNSIDDLGFEKYFPRSLYKFTRGHLRSVVYYFSHRVVNG